MSSSFLYGAPAVSSKFSGEVVFLIRETVQYSFAIYKIQHCFALSFETLLPGKIEYLSYLLWVTNRQKHQRVIKVLLAPAMYGILNILPYIAGALLMQLFHIIFFRKTETIILIYSYLVKSRFISFALWTWLNFVNQFLYSRSFRKK